MATATKEETQAYFGGREGDQDAGGRELLPTREKKGAPKDALYLFQMIEDEVELKQSGEEAKIPDHPFIAFDAEVLAPEEFEGERVRGMFYFPAMPEDTDDLKAMKKFDEQMKRTVGQVDGILGEGTMASLAATSLEDSLDELIPLLDGVSFVGKVGFEKAKGGFPAKSRITRYVLAETWTEAE